MNQTAVIQFFKQIRLNLIKKEKVVKYLLYATGEIVLVVIGILLALYVNNINQKDREEREVKILLDKSFKELEGNIHGVSYNINLWLEKDSIYHMTMQDKINAQDFLNEEVPHDWYLNLPLFRADHYSLGKVLNNEEKLPDELEHFNRLLKVLDNRKTNLIDPLNIELRKIVDGIIDEEKKYSWASVYNDDMISEKIDYLLENYLFKNIATQFHFKGVKNYAVNLSNYRHWAIQCYYELGEYLGRKDVVTSFQIPDDYQWLAGNWINNKSETSEFSSKWKGFYKAWDNDYTQYINYNNQNERLALLRYLGNNHFYWLEYGPDQEEKISFVKMEMVNENLFHLISYKRDTITYRRTSN